MPDFTIRTTNGEFFTEARLADLPEAGDALDAGVRGAIMIAADEIGKGVAAATVEVTVEDQAGRPVLRAAVTIAVAPLAVGLVEQRDLPLPGADRG